MYVKGGKQSLGMLTRYFYLVLIILIPFSLYENLSLFFFFTIMEALIWKKIMVESLQVMNSPQSILKHQHFNTCGDKES